MYIYPELRTSLSIISVFCDMTVVLNTDIIQEVLSLQISSLSLAKDKTTKSSISPRLTWFTLAKRSTQANKWIGVIYHDKWSRYYTVKYVNKEPRAKTPLWTKTTHHNFFPISSMSGQRLPVYKDHIWMHEQVSIYRYIKPVIFYVFSYCGLNYHTNKK